jgi:hypothetical protein
MRYITSGGLNVTLAQMQTCGRQWQEKLGLKDWAISFSWGAKGDLGRCYWHPDECHADVEVNARARDKEATLVHELLHIVIQGHEDFPGYNVEVERAINKITAALLGRPIQ